MHILYNKLYLAVQFENTYIYLQRFSLAIRKVRKDEKLS